MSIKILFIMPSPIHPVNNGGKIAIYNRIIGLKNYNVKIYGIFWGDPNNGDNEIFEDYLSLKKNDYLKMIFYSLLYPTKSIRLLLRCKKRIKKIIIDKIDTWNIDVVQIEHDFLIDFVDLRKIKKPIFIMVHSLSFLSYYRNTIKEKNLFLKCLYFTEIIKSLISIYKLFNKKRRFINKFFFVSHHEMKYIKKKFSKIKNQCDFVPIKLNLKSYRNNISNRSHSSINIGIIGSYSSFENRDSVYWFVNKILPLVNKEIDNIRIVIAGNYANRYFFNLERNNQIIIMSDVEKIEDVYNTIDISILPLRGGGGVRLKLLEAIAYKKPIVATSLAVIGSGIKDNESIKIADDETYFSKCIINTVKSIDHLKSNFDSINKSNLAFISSKTQAIEMIDNYYSGKN